MVSLADRRRHQRNPIDWPVSVYVPRLSRFVNGRSVDVSQGGARISLPVGVPVRPGQIVELNFPRTSTLAKVAGCYSRIKTAVVVRIEGEAGYPGSLTSADQPAHAVPAFPFSAGLLAIGKGSPISPTLMTSPAKTRPGSPGRRRQMVAVHFDKSALSLVK